MAEVEIPMSQLLFLAIGTPERGAVNFNLLQKFLFEIMKMSDLENLPVLVNEEELKKLSSQDLPQPSEITGETEQKKSLSGAERRKSSVIDPAKIVQISEDFAHLKSDMEKLSEKVTEMSLTADTTLVQDLQTGLQQIDGVQERLKTVEDLLENIRNLNPTDMGGQNVDQRLQYIESQLENHSESLTKLYGVVDEQINSVFEKFAHLEHNLGGLRDTSHEVRRKSINSRRLSDDITQEHSASINNLVSRLSSVQQDLDNLMAISNQLNDQQESKQMAMDVLTEEIQMLKMVKADKVNMEDILAAKADISQVHEKVSYDQMDIRIKELSEQINDAVNQVDAHKELLQEEVEDLKAGIESKLDKEEFLPLKEYVDDRLNNIQNAIKTIAMENRKGMAAGSKRQIRDVQCISCDNEARMKTDNTFEEMSPSPALPIQKNVKPYLTYKLDQVRKQQKKIPTGKNLLHFEEMLHEAKYPQKTKFCHGSSEHLVNRYVGGSHTTTTPTQRLTRVGNFFETWGPVITAVNHPQPIQPIPSR